MMQGKSALNPYANPYVPISKLLSETSSETQKYNDNEFGDFENKEADLAAEYHLPDSVSVDFETQNFEKLDVSGESSSKTLLHGCFDDSFQDEFAEFESQYLMDDQSIELDSLCSMFPNISVDCLSELLRANYGDFNTTIDAVQQLEYDGDESEYSVKAAESSRGCEKASASGASNSV